MAGDLLYSEHFGKYKDGSGVAGGWWVEGGERVWIDGGRLRVKANPAKQEGSDHVCTVWNKQAFSGDLEVSFRTCVLDSTNKANNINFFLCFSEAEGGDLYESRGLRKDGASSHYHGLNGYIFTFLNDRHGESTEDGARCKPARFRIRRCPGFHLLTEVYDYHCRKGVIYDVRIIKRGGEISFAVDGKVYLETADPDPWEGGWIGLRTFQTDLWWDEIRISRPDA